jgi:hypothetical protein
MLRIGRDSQNEIILQDPKVSRIHATLSEINNSLLLRDEESSNGTLVNGVEARGLTFLKIGDRLSIGDANFQVVETLPEPSMPPQPVFVPPVTPTILPPSPAQTAKPKKKGVIWPLYFLVFLVVLCAMPPILGAAYYKAPQSTKNRILNIFGKGPATIQIENFSDNAVYVFTSLNLERTPGDYTVPIFQWNVDSFGTNDIVADAGVYRIDFGSQDGQIDLGTCILNLKGGEVYDFTILPGDILISVKKSDQSNIQTPSSVDELDVATSSLCKGQD